MRRPSILGRLYRPELYQGPGRIGRPRPYFEGWYFRLSSPERNLAVIPGISLAESDPHAFVQVIRGSGGASSYTRFPLGEFSAGHSPFRIALKDNCFSLEEMRLDLPGLRADLAFSRPRRWPAAPLSPSSMGPYAFLRFLECYHGVILLAAGVRGSLEGRRFAGGSLYLEKDWGVGFPRGWVWMQCSSFEEPAVLTCSVARVPLKTRSFTGFIIGLLAAGKLYRFTTYNGAELTGLRSGDGEVEIAVRRGRQTLRLRARRARGAPGTTLASPHEGAMGGRIVETLDAEIELELAEGGRSGFRATGRRAGLEVVRPQELGAAVFSGPG